MAIFYLIDDGGVLLYAKGIYRQAKLYKRVGHEEFYANYGGGQVRLDARPGTSCPNISWLEASSKKLTIDERGKIKNAT